jgi:hypothetical protein
MSWKALAVAAGLLLAAAGPSAVAFPQRLSNEQVLQNLSVVMFGSEFVGEDTDTVRKWMGPMRVAVYGDEMGRFDDLVAMQLATMHRLSGLDIQRVPANDPDANAHVFFIDPRGFRAVANSRLPQGKPGTNENLACFGIFKTNSERRIFAFDAVIPRSGSREEIKACLIEELTQMLGLPNDSNDIHPTVFNDDDEYHRLTWQDELMVRVLYDPRIVPGMSRTAFAATAAAVIEDLRATDAPLVAEHAPRGGSTVAVAAAGRSHEVIETLR